MTLDETATKAANDKYNEQFNAFNTWLDSIMDKLWNECTQAAQKGEFGTYIKIPEQIRYCYLVNETLNNHILSKLKNYSNEPLRVYIHNGMLNVFWGYRSLG